MSLELDANLPADAVDADDDIAPNWGGRIIVTVATALAVLVVAAMAVLMGMS